MWYGSIPPVFGPVYDGEQPARAMLDHVAERVVTAYPALTVETRLSLASGAPALIEASHDATLVLVGTRL